MSQEAINENQQVNLDAMQKWLAQGRQLSIDVRIWMREGQQLFPQFLELFSLVRETDFLKDIQKTREDMIVEQMASDAGLIVPVPVPKRKLNDGLSISDFQGYSD